LIFNKIQYTIFFLITMDFKRVLSTKTNVKQQNECHRLFKVDSLLNFNCNFNNQLFKYRTSWKKRDWNGQNDRLSVILATNSNSAKAPFLGRADTSKTDRAGYGNWKYLE